MNTLRHFANTSITIPVSTSWYLQDLGEARGKQELFTRQSPQRLKLLREHALIESAVSSNRIEGVEVEQSRIGTLVFGTPHLRDRDEEEVQGYRQALSLIHKQGAELPVTEEAVLQLHRLTRGDIWDAGKYKEKDSGIIERSADGRTRVRFKTVSAAKTPAAMSDLISLHQEQVKEARIPPLLLMTVFNLDFLCIHPFCDGNGRVSRLLLLLQCYHQGLEVGRYISLERLIEQNKERYYETLEQCSQGWYQSKHDPWPYINFVLYILKYAYKEFEERLRKQASPRGEKTDVVLRVIGKLDGPFRVSDFQRECPGVSIDWIRKVLRKLRDDGQVECLGRGPNAEWRKIGS